MTWFQVEGLGWVVDVIFDPCVVTRAVEGPKIEYYRNRLTELAVPFVHQDEYPHPYVTLTLTLHSSPS